MSKMDDRVEIINSFYNDWRNEDSRLTRSRQGQLEYLTTMHYIHRFIPAGANILEVGAGTGRYSVALAREKYTVTAVELGAINYEGLRKRCQEIENITAIKGDALDLQGIRLDSFDGTLLLGPLYHLYDRNDQLTALREAVRVTKNEGIIITAFLSVHAIMYNNYLQGNWRSGEKENFTEDFKVKHFDEQLFTGFNLDEFELLFSELPTERMTLAAADGILELAQGREDFAMSDEEFQDYVRYHLHHCERHELLGSSSHLLYICRVHNKS